MGNQLTNLSKELNIDINDLTACQFMILVNHDYIYTPIDVDQIKNAFTMMNQCYYKHMYYVCNTLRYIKLNFKNHDDLIIALSDCGRYVGLPTNASACGQWFYLLDNHQKEYTPFYQFR